ncbi:MAG: HEAT repeat domain-containing protein [Byssovorax sp.]
MRARYLVSALATLAVAGAALTAWVSTHPTTNSGSLAHAATSAASSESVSGRSQPTGARSIPVRQWKTGDTFLYAVEATRSASVGGESQAAQSVVVHLAGSLALTLTGQDAAGVQVRADMRSPRYDVTPRPEQDGSASLVQPFYFTARSSGEMTAFHFAKSVPAEVRILLKGLTTALQLVTPPLPGAAWRVTEQDGSGEYQAAYRVADGAVHKTKEKYLRTRGTKGLSPIPESSTYAVTSSLDFGIDSTGWPATVVEDETLDVAARSVRVVAKSKTKARLVSVEAHPEIKSALNDADFESDALTSAAARALGKRQADRSLVDGKTFPELQVPLISSDVHERNRTQSRMAALFRLDPAAPREAEEAVLHGSIDENAKKRLLGALGSAGTPEAQQALASILETKDAPRSLRADAAVALGVSKQVTPEGEQAIVKAMDSSDKEIADTATLAAGNQARTMITEQSGDPRDVVETLIARLVAASSDEERTLCLRALGNTGDLRALPAIQPYLTHSDVALRALATSSLRFMDGSEIDALLIAAMADKDATVRVAAVGTVPARPVTPLLAALDALLHSDAEVTVRLAIVNALNLKRSEDPAVDASLTWAAEKDPSDAVKLLANQALGKK